MASSSSSAMSSAPGPSSASFLAAGQRGSISSSRRRSSHTIRSVAARRHSTAEINEEDEEVVDPFLISLDSDDFDPASWLDAQLDSSSPQNSAASAPLPSLDTSLSGLLTKISLARSDVSASVDREIAAAKRNVPRIMGELGWIGKSVEGLDAKLTDLGRQALPSGSGSQTSRATEANGEVGNGITDPEKDSAKQDPLARLADLHKLHTHLGSYRALLRLASSWSTLSSDVSLLLTEASQSTTSSVDSLANFNSASLRLKEARESLEVFGSEKEGKEKAALLGRLTDSFEAAVGPKLVAKVRSLQSDTGGIGTASPASSETLEIIKSYASVLTRVGRGAAFGEYWRGTRRQAILEHWSKAQLLEAQSASSSNIPASPNATALSVYLPSFFSSLLNLLATERIYMPLLYPSNQHEALDLFLTSTLSMLKPSLRERIASVKQYRKDESLNESLRLVRTIRERGREMEKILARLAAATATPVAEADVHGMRKTSSQTSLENPVTSPPLAKSSEHASGGQSYLDVQATPLGRRRSSARRPSAALPPSNRRISMVGAEGQANGNSPSIAQTQAQAVDFEFADVLYSSLLPMWETYAESELALFQNSWSRESKALSLLHSNHASDGSVGDEMLPSALDRLQRSFSALSDSSEDALSRCLELTRGLGARGMLNALDAVVSSSIEASAREVEESCRRTWSSLVGPNSHAPVGREWSAFGRIITALAGLRTVFKKAEDLQALLVEGLRESANLLLTFSPGAAVSIKDQALPDKLAKLKGTNGSGINGPVPTSAEMLVLLESSLASSEQEKATREQIVTLAAARHSIIASGASAMHSHNTLVRPQALPLLPRLSQSLPTVLNPLLHSMLVLPLVPVLSLLSQYPSLPTWTSTTLPGQVSNEYQLAMPSFSLGPTEVMQTVGESVLGLVRELESWMGEAGWKWGVELLLLRERGTEDDSAGATAEEAAGKKEREKKERRRSSMLPPGRSESNGSTSTTTTTGKDHRRRSSFLPPTASNQGRDSSSPTRHRSQASIISPQQELNLSGGLTVPNRDTLTLTGETSTSPAEVTPPFSRRDTGQEDGASSEALSDLATAMQPTSSEQEQQSQSQVHSESLLPVFISRLLSYLITHLLTHILPALPPIERISDAGWRQLEADLEWLKRVVGVLEGGGSAEIESEREAGTEAGPDGEEQATSELQRLDSWRKVVGLGVGHPALLPLASSPASTSATATTATGKAAAAAAAARDEFGYVPFYASPSTAGASGRAPTVPGTGPSALDPISVRQMLQSQRRSGASTPTGGAAGRPDSRGPPPTSGAGGNGSGTAGGGGGGGRQVDLNAMSVNVGMGW
ncbi:hypothetical protein BCV69DRAFT_282668 [Microstroma glucosiphilum]|uniref:Conserved oligomeric Golgi complex subunit 7 n=1 Tax=Pseudomicrostroma glucosiphilum TaxID=1684307 RepID=A0A316U7G3_9BASI|nr:hypothetical protein BCV69DRAFT_282668 [Pseudomicrostroma glucosiphilum]PWN21177.1 hypothetical protein BCV69DRAFT_282668 [Pseudomicrostroma glucosiphilum]